MRFRVFLKMCIRDRFKSAYENRFKCFLILGTNNPVRITNAKSGIVRRLIDVEPTGNKVPAKKYEELISQIDFELGEMCIRDRCCAGLHDDRVSERDCKRIEEKPLEN